METINSRFIHLMVRKFDKKTASRDLIMFYIMMKHHTKYIRYCDQYDFEPPQIGDTVILKPVIDGRGRKEVTIFNQQWQEMGCLPEAKGLADYVYNLLDRKNGLALIKTIYTEDSAIPTYVLDLSHISDFL